MKKIIMLAGALVALAAPAAASADSSTGSGLCQEGRQGKNATSNTNLADFESPQKGSPLGQALWAATARAGGGITVASTTTYDGNGTNGSSSWVYCHTTFHWNKSTGFGAGEDYFVVSFVTYYTPLSGGGFRPVAFGSHQGISYWKADSNGATALFNVAMPWSGGQSNYSYPRP